MDGPTERIGILALPFELWRLRRRIPARCLTTYQARAQSASCAQLHKTIDRPPVHSNERMCVRCSLAPVCLPEEERLAERRATLGPMTERQRAEVFSNEIPAGSLLQKGRDGGGDATIGDDEPSPAAGGLSSPERGGAGRFADNCAARGVVGKFFVDAARR
ncbi:MAG: hypothetical protein EXS05_20905 [Planctomycetaceae bacterium]|nr:hypothetical protein [Planctomycetaceae bacterium]